MKITDTGVEVTAAEFATLLACATIYMGTAHLTTADRAQIAEVVSDALKMLKAR